MTIAQEHGEENTMGVSLPEEVADTSVDGTRKYHTELLATVPPLKIDDVSMHKLAPAEAEELPEIVVAPHEQASTLPTSNRPGQIKLVNVAVRSSLQC